MCPKPKTLNKTESLLHIRTGREIHIDVDQNMISNQYSFTNSNISNRKKGRNMILNND